MTRAVKVSRAWSRCKTEPAAKFRGVNMKLRTLAFFSAMTLFVALGITAQTFAQNTQPTQCVPDRPESSSQDSRSIR